MNATVSQHELPAGLSVPAVHEFSCVETNVIFLSSLTFLYFIYHFGTVYRIRTYSCPFTVGECYRYTKHGIWCPGRESNPRRVNLQSTALPTELPRHLVRLVGVEPTCYPVNLSTRS